MSTSSEATRRRSAAVTLINGDEKIIFIRRRKRDGDPWSGQIAFPGGFVREGEIPLEAAVRESYEEIGYRPSKLSFFGIYHPNNAELDVYAFTDKEALPSDLRAGDEVQDVLVIDRNELKTGKTASGYPCYTWRDVEIWGLTYRILRDYLTINVKA